MQISTRYRWFYWIVIAGVMTLGSVLSARACDTPVYRYAMYRWFPAPYEVYYFYQDKMSDSATAIKKIIDKNQEIEGPIANIVFLPVDLNKDKELTSVPPDIKEAWQKQEKPTIPNYLISSPFGLHLYMGKLEESELEPLVDSPVRQQIGKQLAQGKAGVFILLKGEDEKANENADKILKSVVRDVSSGKVELYMMPSYGPPDGADAGADAVPPHPQVGMVELKRDDPKEKWLAKTLLSLEPDLLAEKGPIVFLIYGRGRALFSCLGKGIVRDNLLQDVEFITGACSCTVKDGNPGIDLLMRFDWDTAAMKLAQSFGPEEGNEYGAPADNAFPELIIPSTDQAAEPQDAPAGKPADDTLAKADPNAGAPGAADATMASTEPKTDASADVATKPASEPTQSAPAKAEKAAGGPRTAIAEIPLPRHDDEQAAPSGMSGILAVGLGLVGLLVILFAATFLVLRPK